MIRLIDDYDITNLNSDELADYRNKYIGFIFQSFYLNSNLTKHTILFAKTDTIPLNHRKGTL